MPATLTDDACKKIIKLLARKLEVNAVDVVTKLLDEDAKTDLRNGEFPLNSLELHIKVWKEAGCPDYVNLYNSH